MKDIQKVNYDDIEIIDTDCSYCGIDRYKLNGQFFTGIIYEKYEKGYYEFSVVDGIEDGKFYSLYSNGQKRDEGINRNGYEIEKTEYSISGQKITQFTKNFFRKWSETGILLSERNYEKWSSKDYYITGELKCLGFGKQFNREKWFSGVDKAGFDMEGLPCYYVPVEEQYFTKSGELLLTRYADERKPKNAVKKYNWWFIFEDTALQNNFKDILDEEMADIFGLINICAWVKHLLNTTKAVGIEFLNRMIEHSDLRIKYAALLIARDLKVKEVLPTIKTILHINEKPPPDKNSSYGWTISYLANEAIHRIRSPFARKDKN